MSLDLRVIARYLGQQAAAVHDGLLGSSQTLGIVLRVLAQQPLKKRVHAFSIIGFHEQPLRYTGGSVCESASKDAHDQSAEQNLAFDGADQVRD